jgi:hypothetical protein
LNITDNVAAFFLQLVVCDVYVEYSLGLDKVSELYLKWTLFKQVVLAVDLENTEPVLSTMSEGRELSLSGNLLVSH